MKSCCGDEQTPKSDAAVEVFDPAAPTGCCAPAATMCNTTTAQSNSSCCSAKTLDVSSAPSSVKGAGCCSPGSDISKSNCAVVAPPSALYSLAEPSRASLLLRLIMTFLSMLAAHHLLRVVPKSASKTCLPPIPTKRLVSAVSGLGRCAVLPSRP